MLESMQIRKKREKKKQQDFIDIIQSKVLPL